MQTIEFQFGWDQLNIIGHAISWHLGGQYHRIPRPQLSEDDNRLLSQLHQGICHLIQQSLSGLKPILIVDGGTHAKMDNSLAISKKQFLLMNEAVSAFIAELGHSHNEVEIITGVPFSRTQETLSQLQSMNNRLE